MSIKKDESLLMKDPIVVFATLNDGREILLGNYWILESDLLRRYKKAAENTLALSQVEQEEIQQQVVAELEAYKQRLRATPAKKRVEPRQHAYIMLNNRNGYYKIGLAQKPVYRERTLQAEDPDIQLVYVSEHKYRWEDEQNVHDIFKANRLRGEWFKLDLEQVAQVKEMLK